jgi:benzoyl-CoA reductase subunit C
LESNIKSGALKEFEEVSKTLVNPAMQEWKENGGKVVGTLCSYVPEEIITAAGILPFRMRATGSKETEKADVYLSNINCSFVRNCLNLGLEGKYDFIDGAVWLNTCDHVRRIYDNWKEKVKTPFLHFMTLPRKIGDIQVDRFRDELDNFKKALENQFDVSITDDKLWEAIKLHNETRRLQRKLNDFKKMEKPPISGAQTLAAMVAGTALPKKRYNKLLKELIGELEKSEHSVDHRARIMLVGGILDDPEYVKVIEEQGGLVVTDSLCFGSRLAWKDVDEKAGDPLAALAKYHMLERPACPRMFGHQDKRADYLRDMIKEFNVDAVIGERIVFCDFWAGEHFMLTKQFKKENIPFLKLDREYLLSGVGQLRTRVQSFLETIEGGKS